MPTFVFNKLVRDGLVEEYERTNQRATYRHLTHDEKIEALTAKVMEELAEAAAGGDAKEFADVQQALDDLIKAKGILKEAVEKLQAAKYAAKGGFEGGHFVETLELDEDDEWVEYYRAHPEIFEEL